MENGTLMRRSFLAIALLLVYIPAWGATYYVDATGGNDSNSGVATNQAWRTINKVNQGSFSPGDSILLKRGEVWRDSLVVPSSGSAGNVITFKDYGSGALPILNASNLITSWTSGNVANTWKATVTTEPKIVLFNGIRGTNVGSQTACDGARKWYWASNILYTYGTADPSTIYTNPGVEAGERTFLILDQGHNYVTFQNLDLRNSNQFGIRIQYCDYVTVDGVNITQTFYNGTSLDNGGGQHTNYITFQNMNVSNHGGYGILVAGDGNTNNITIKNNIVHDGGWNSLNDNNLTTNGAIKVWGGANGGVAGQSNNVLIEGNTVYNQADQFSDYSGTGIYVDQWGNNAVVRNNKVYGNSAYGILIENTLSAANPPPMVYYNIVYSNKKGISINRNVKGAFVYNNVSYGNTLGGLICEGVGTEKTMQNNIFQNNISTGNGTNLIAILGGENAGGGSGNVYTYNSFGSEASRFIEWGSRTFINDYTQFETSYGATTNSLGSDPLMTDPLGGNFALRSSSPAINAGTNVFLTTDYAGYKVPSGSAPDIGAFEYQESSHIPSPPNAIRVN